jgi:hypothetical protein
MRSGLTRRPTPGELAQASRSSVLAAPTRFDDPTGDAPRLRSHGDPTGGQRRPSRPAAHVDPSDGMRRPQLRERSLRADPAPRTHRDPSGGQRRPADVTGEIKRRRSNVLFALLVTTSCTLFLAATMSSDVMLYLFVASFLSLSTYVYLLAQQNNGRRPMGMNDRWVESY